MKNNFPYYQSKLPNTGTSIFTVMSKMAAENNAINLSQGFPDFNCPSELLNLVEHYMKKGYNQYAPMPGLLSLRKKITGKILKLYGRDYNPETEITITAGATEAIYTAITTLITKGDEVIILEPAYDSYAPSVTVNGGIPLFIPLNNDFSIDWQRVKDNLSKRTKLLIINSPHNPTGSVIKLADLKILEDITRSANIFLISDEVYEHIIFDGERHISISESEELSEKSFVISSFGKTYHTTGWKTGYCAAPENLMNEFRKIHQFIVFAVNTPIQHAYSDFMSNENHYIELNNFYQKKRDLFLNGLINSAFTFKPAKGTYFQLLNYSGISNDDDFTFSEFLTKKIKVAAIPLSPFYSSEKRKGIVRLCFAKTDDVLIEAAKRLSNINKKALNIT